MSGAVSSTLYLRSDTRVPLTAYFNAIPWGRPGTISTIGPDLHRGGKKREASSSAHRNAVDQPLQERLAAGDLVERDELVGFVRLVDRAGAADDRRDAGGGEEAALGAESDLG